MLPPRRACAALVGSSFQHFSTNAKSSALRTTNARAPRLCRFQLAVPRLEGTLIEDLVEERPLSERRRQRELGPEIAGRGPGRESGPRGFLDLVEHRRIAVVLRGVSERTMARHVQRVARASPPECADGCRKLRWNRIDEIRKH